MAQDTTRIVVGASGTVRVAPTGTTAPTDATTAYSGTWIDVGLATNDGVTMTDSKNVNEIGAWQLFYAARRVITTRNFEVKFVLEQWDKFTVPLAFGGGTIDAAPGGGGGYRYRPPSPGVIDNRALAIDWTDGSKHYRIIVFNGMVSDNVETKLARTDASLLPITFSVIGSASSDPYVMYSDDAAWAASS